MPQATHISGYNTAMFWVEGNAGTYIIDKGARIETDMSSGMFITDSHASNTIIVKGRIEAGRYDNNVAVYVSGENTQITVAKTGTLKGHDGIEVNGAGETVTNNGRILGADTGVLLHKDAHLENNGLLSASYGIKSYGNGAMIFNGEEGRIQTFADSVSTFGAFGATTTLINEGLIKSGHAAAIAGGEGQELVVNHGMIKGEIWLGEGDDVFDNRGGKLDHAIGGDNGNDTYLIDSAKTHIFERASNGLDVVQSTVMYTLSAYVEKLELLGKADINGKGNDGYNDLVGNKGDNKLQALDGDDRLNGAGGNDILRGGEGADTFEFATNGGHDVIVDFVSGKDQLDLGDFLGIADDVDLFANHLKTSGKDFIIYDGGDTLTLRNAVVNGFTADDVHF